MMMFQMMMLHMMVQCLHIDVGKLMIQKMFLYSHTDNIEYGPEDEATDDDSKEDDPEYDSTFICLCCKR